jgi:hypothetical protein
MRLHLPLLSAVAGLVVAGCNTAPIPPGKPVDIPTALRQVAAGLCAYKADAEAQKHGTFDSVTVELDLTIDGAKDPPVAVAPDIQFMPTVSYGQTISVTKGSKLRLTLKNTDACNMAK